ncbi:SGNH/GDSL hydrolase family protein [Jiulongibacter sediminis]|jgi:lysophospholipase L1-like esterase|uniref:SGNH/GDSL hydrolase family protein n=1 Tax=Jiulongibacter sediminis TaxID=1605367 RepID=UPI0026EF2E50|nr:SGNH/GDSL hydrolase family protein [Jiulongibacter sediminis]
MKYLFLIISVFVVACQKKTAPSSSASGSSLRYLALGDSYTIGERVSEEKRWPIQLAAKLQPDGFDIAKPQIIARTGWTTDELDRGINQANPTGEFDLVSLLIGVNNQYRGRSSAEYATEFEALLKRAIDFANGKKERVFVVSIPDYGVTPFAKNRNPEKIGREIDEFNAAQKRICEKYQIDFYDITPISREAVQNPSLVAGDGLHPSGEMYKLWVESFYDKVKQKLGK